tara:strand:+ start:694 stop:828 length:135 start_codon:yes stop_codon:yes gene_type:complete
MAGHDAESTEFRREEVYRKRTLHDLEESVGALQTNLEQRNKSTQ